MSNTDPFLLDATGTTKQIARLSRVHREFDERFIQELLVANPELLPVATLRPDVGELVCIGREVATHDSGSIDNLYLSTAGYIVVVETKLWRNPQGRREVVSQVLDYVKDIVQRDFAWLESVWHEFCRNRSLQSQSLIERMAEATNGELDEVTFIDRVHRVIDRGDVIALIVGDGIESRLQQLVSHLCRDSAHLRYSLGLISLRCYQMPIDGTMLILPELVQEVEPVQRAYVRIELSEALSEVASVTSVVEQEQLTPTDKRITLSEEDFYNALEQVVGKQAAQSVRVFVEDVSELGVEPDFKSAAIMLKVPDPTGESVGASLLAIEKKGRIYNPDHGLRQVVKTWGWANDAGDRTIGAYWRKLHSIDVRFSVDGISHVATRKFLPLDQILDKLDSIRAAMGEAVVAIQLEAG